MYNIANINNAIPARSMLKSLLGIILIFAGAQIVIPIKPVHITLHTFVILLIGLTYSVRESVSSVSGSIMLGMLGLPIFSGFNSGIAYLLGPVGGYYTGMLLASLIMPILKRQYNIPNLFVCFAGLLAIYIPGVVWLSNFIGMESAIYNGCFVFIPSGIVKTLFLVTILRIMHK